MGGCTSDASHVNAIPSTMELFDFVVVGWKDRNERIFFKPVEAIGQRSDDDAADTECENETGSCQQLVLDPLAVVIPLAEQLISVVLLCRNTSTANRINSIVITTFFHQKKTKETN